MRFDLFWYNCLDLPSLTKIQGNGEDIHEYMGHVILESMIWFDLISLDISNLTENNIHYGYYPFSWTADLQATSTFHFISIFTFRCSWSWKLHSKKVEIFWWEFWFWLFNFLRNLPFISLTRNTLYLSISCLIIVTFSISMNSNFCFKIFKRTNSFKIHLFIAYHKWLKSLVEKTYSNLINYFSILLSRSTLAQGERAGLITLRSVDWNYEALSFILLLHYFLLFRQRYTY